MADKEQVERPPTVQERVKNAMATPGVPQIYANGFVNTLASGDVITTLERNGQPVALLNLSFTVAKTLARSLTQIVAQMEELTEREMLTTHEVERALQKKKKESSQ